MTFHLAIALSVVLALAYLTAAACAAIVAALRVGGRRKATVAADDPRSVSRFTIPVSIIVPVARSSALVSRTVASLLDLNYPELEVIVVADEGAPSLVDALGREWSLEAREFFYRRTIDTAEVHRMHRSARDPRLLVITKAPSGHSDAVNCGVNVARYRYFVAIAPEIVFDADALLRVMTAALRDPATVVGASSHLDCAPGNASNVLARAGAMFQQMASIRSLMDSGIAWRRLRSSLAPNGAVVVWRRDVVLKVRGFSTDAADADLDLMFRLQASGDDTARIDSGGQLFGRVDPQPFRGALRAAGRRQLASLQVLWMTLRGKVHTLETRTLAYFIESELVTPLAQLWVAVATIGGAFAGWFAWSTTILIVTMLAFGTASVTAAALLLRGAAPGAPEEPELHRLLLVAPLEFVLYRPALALARLAAALAFVTGTTRASRAA